MKQITSRLLAALLTLVLCFSAAAQPLSAAAPVGTNAATNLDEPTYEVQGASAIGIAIGKYAFGRAYAELSSWAISNDVPVIGSLAKLMLNPSQRAALKQSAQVTQILSTVTAISTSVQQISAQLSQISAQLSRIEQEIQELQAQVTLVQWQLAALEKKNDQYHAAELLISVTTELNKVAAGYSQAWSAYCDMYDAVSELEKANTALDAATDPDEIERLTEKAKAADAEVERKIKIFISRLSEGSGMNFSKTIGELQILIYDPANPSASYLGALEAYLRLTEPFEHQITEQLSSAMESCAYILERVFYMYSEYYTYLRAQAEEKNKDNPDAENPYDAYTDEFFNDVSDDLVEYFNDTAISSGIAGFMVSEPMSEKEIAEYREYDPSFVAPESIDTSIAIGGVNYACYKVRSNSDMQYYLILKQLVDKNTLVQSSSVSYFSSGNVSLYRPGFLLDHEYTDNGRYRLISESELPGFIEDSFTAVLTSLRIDGDLLSLPQSAGHILLRDCSCQNVNGNDLAWNIKAIDTSVPGLSGTVTVKSNDIKNGKTGSNAIAIYRLDTSDTKYKEGIYQVLDKSELENKNICVSDGQTLDLTRLTVDVNNVTIQISGNGKVISNPKITLKNSRITVVDKATVTLENLNITAKKGNVAAIMLMASGTVVNFSGTNNISGTATGSNNAGDYYLNYVPGMPIGASHGIYAPDNTILNFSGTTTCSGADGGAGICVVGKIELLSKSNSAKLIATGSASSIKSGFFPLAIGAGIGGSISVGIEAATGSTSTGNAKFTYYKLRSDKTIDRVGPSAGIQISALTVEATGADISNLNAAASRYAVSESLRSEIKNITFSSDDIGGMSVGGTGYDVTSGTIRNSTVTLKRQKLSSKISTKNQDNSFKPEIYTFTAYTHGSDGVTKDGISFRFHGSKGSSNWIKASDCGVKKGNWSGSFVIDSVGTFYSIEVKANRESDSWFPGKITITTAFGGESLTVYGGREVGAAVSLAPHDNIYKITIETGTEKDSGTNADIFFRLKDKFGSETQTYQLDAIHYESDAFEKGDVATFWLYAGYAFKECVGFYLGSDCSGRGPQWKVDKVSVEKVQGSSPDKDTFTVSPGYWFRIEQTVFFGKNSGNTGAFYIQVKTSDVSKAGTDSNIYLTVNGTKGSTGEIELDAMAEDGDNFERGDLDAMCIGFDTTAIGDIQSITIRKDDAGSGADWHLEYVSIKEILADGQTAQSYKFNWNDWIEDETVTLTKRTKQSVRQSVAKIDRETLSGLSRNDDGSYTLTVDREITLSDSAFELIAEKSAVLTVVMENDDKPLYEVLFDGSAFESWHAVTLGKNYSFTDGKSLFDFLQNVDLPENTKIRIHAKNIGFLDGKTYRLYTKDDSDNWVPLENIVDNDGVIEFYAAKVRELMILDKKNTWVIQPEIEDYVSGETPPAPIGEALFGTFTVHYTGTAADGTAWDSSEAPTRAGKYTAVFTVEAGDEHDGLIYELDFEVTASATEPTPEPEPEPTEPTEPTEPSEPVTPTTPEQPQETGADLTWLYVLIAAVVMFGAGFGTKCLIGKKKKD